MTTYLTPSKDSINAQLLVVDDDPDIRSALARALSLMGYSVTEAGSGPEALALLEDGAYDLMVLDIQMPEMDGRQVMYHTRQFQPELSIIILTGYATLESAIAALKSEVVDYLIKPVSVREISEAVRRAIQKQADRLHRRHLIQVMGETLDALRQTEMPASPVRTNSATASKRFLNVPPLTLDRQKRLLTIGDTSLQTIELTAGETAVLASLMAHPGQVLSCRELTQAAWGYEVNLEKAESLIRPYILRLRRKIETTPKRPRLIRTVRKRGYLLVTSKDKALQKS